MLPWRKRGFRGENPFTVLINLCLTKNLGLASELDGPAGLASPSSNKLAPFIDGDHIEARRQDSCFRSFCIRFCRSLFRSRLRPELRAGGQREQLPQLKVKLPISYRNSESGFDPMR